MQRVNKLAAHLSGSSPERASCASLRPAGVSGGQGDEELLRDTDGGRNPATHWDGWGYADTRLVMDNKTNILTISGGRFAENMGPEGDRLTLNDFIKFAEEELGVDRDLVDRPYPPPPTSETLPKPVSPMPKAFLDAISGIEVTDNAIVRLRRSHGHTCQEVFSMRVTPHKVGRPECFWLPRLVDGVVFPESTKDVKRLIAAAQAHNVILVPRGGGTSVSRALCIPGQEGRSVVSVDMRRMRQILWIDRDNHVACVQAGVPGTELERRLNRLGLTSGHEPDSIDFSTMGGWIATKASGMKRARYGNIEDIVISVNMETCVGTLGPGENAAFERVSAGPDISKSLAIGSEGTMGIVTDCLIKLRPLPTHRKYGSVLFKDFDTGVGALRDLARKGLLPSSARLMDNSQFKLGQALRPIARFQGKNQLKEAAKSMYIESWNGFDIDKVAAATFMYEGFSAQQIAEQERNVFSICKQHGGAQGDGESGKRGYFLTFMIAYLRDFGLALNFLSESFEATVPWSKVSTLIKAVENKIHEIAQEGGVKETPLIGVRVSQAYETCCCCYFYFGIVVDDPEEKMHVFSKIEHDARATIIEHGGSISHHHGVGKAKKDFFPLTQSETSLNLLQKSIKTAIDPRNVFGVGNLGM